MIRILHVVEKFEGQAVESWLTRILSNPSFPSSAMRFDFFLICSEPGKYAADVIKRGCRLYVGKVGSGSIPNLALALRKCVVGSGYDIVDIHQDVLAGPFAAALLGTGVKIVTHVHNCWQQLPVGGNLRKQFLTWIAKRMCLCLSDAIVGVSKQALEQMIGGNSRRSRVDTVLYCSPKCSNLVSEFDNRAQVAHEIRALYGIPESAKVVLFLGRLDPYKNPVFALKVFQKLIEMPHPNCYLLIAGVGGLNSELATLCDKEELRSRVKLVGWVREPERLLLACDLLLMPSQEWYGEGLGLAAVEAQACGVPVLCSRSIPADAEVVPGLINFHFLGEGVTVWANSASALLATERRELSKCRGALALSNFAEHTSCESITSFYAGLYAGKVET